MMVIEKETGRILNYLNPTELPKDVYECPHTMIINRRGKETFPVGWFFDVEKDRGSEQPSKLLDVCKLCGKEIYLDTHEHLGTRWYHVGPLPVDPAHDAVSLNYPETKEPVPEENGATDTVNKKMWWEEWLNHPVRKQLTELATQITFTYRIPHSIADTGDITYIWMSEEIGEVYDKIMEAIWVIDRDYVQAQQNKNHNL